MDMLRRLINCRVIIIYYYYQLCPLQYLQTHSTLILDELEINN